MVVGLPVLTRLGNQMVKWIAGAEGRLAAIAVETSRPLGPMPRVWSALAQGGENQKDFLIENEKTVTALSPGYIRIDHVYDGFGVVRRTDKGLVYDWTELDKVVTKILQVGAKPFLALSYMPEAISSGDILSEPRNWNEWSQVVQATIEHYSGEMAIDNVYYEVWNEPDLFGGWRMGGRKDYKSLYYYAALGAAEAEGVKKFKIGGPATTGLYRNWIDNFFPFILKNNIRLDFFSWHRYDLKLEKYSQDVDSIDRWLENQPYFSGVEKIISEMGPASEPGGANDNNLGAAHTVAVMRELVGKIKYGFSFAVSGKWGLVDKPRYQALEFLSRLGDERLSVTGEGTWVKTIASRQGNKIGLVVVNYDSRGRHYEVVPVSFLGLKQRSFKLKKQWLGQGIVEVQVATTEAVLQTNLVMPPNSVAWVELEPKN